MVRSLPVTEHLCQRGRAAANTILLLPHASSMYRHHPNTLLKKYPNTKVRKAGLREQEDFPLVWSTEASRRAARRCRAVTMRRQRSAQAPGRWLRTEGCGTAPGTTGERLPIPKLSGLPISPVHGSHSVSKR